MRFQSPALTHQVAGGGVEQGDFFSLLVYSSGGEEGCYLLFLLERPKQLPRYDWVGRGGGPGDKTE